MNHIITISTSSYILNTQRLLISLNRTNKDFKLTVFCDQADSFGHLKTLGNCEVRELPAIRTLGVKRAKFEAYYLSSQETDFLYLDSDVIVLDELSGLFQGDRLKASYDDLSSCDFITDKQYPWGKSTNVRNEIYVNSGVLYCPRSRVSFFRELYESSLQDEVWNAYILEGKLYDNHFLCALLNLKREQIDLIDEEVYNWQGFCKNGAVVVDRQEDSLVNRVTGKKLRIVHFAGIQDIDGFIISLPVNISSFLCHHFVDNRAVNERALFMLLGAQSRYFQTPLDDAFVTRVGASLFAEIDALSREEYRGNYSAAESYFSHKDDLISLAYTKPNSVNRWNDLKCDGAYLEAVEYVYLRNILVRYRISSVIETGAGETSIFFKSRGVRALSLETQDGPWLEKARDYGCNVEHVAFSRTERMFDPAVLSKVLSTSAKAFDLIFIDSPVGKSNRQRILSQLLGLIKAKYVLFHDAYRDCSNIYGDQNTFGLKMIDFFESTRGLVLFEIGKRAKRSPLAAMRKDMIVTDTSCVLEFPFHEKSWRKKTTYSLSVRLRNTGKDVFSSSFSNPVCISYHWLDQNGSIVINDGLRTVLPCDVHPNDSITFEMKVLTPENSGTFILDVDLVQELVRWFRPGSRSLSGNIACKIHD